jgi:hypothetical protein
VDSSKALAKTDEEASTSSFGVGSSVGGGVGVVEDGSVEGGEAKEAEEGRAGEEPGEEKSMKDWGDAEGSLPRRASEVRLWREGGGGVEEEEGDDEEGRLTAADEEAGRAGGVRDCVTSPLLPSPRRAEGDREVEEEARREKRGAGEMPR